VKPADVKKTAFAMPLTAPSYPRGPYRFIDREYMIITYRTDPAILNVTVWGVQLQKLRLKRGGAGVSR
jgi:acetoacetate decarboxylase